MVDNEAAFCSHCGSQVGRAAGDKEQRRPSAESIATGEQRLLKTLREVTLGEYEVLSEIGRGGMAVVFLAHDIALNRRVAIKCMAPALMLMDKGIQERFQRESRTAAGLSHPHIIPVYAVKESHDLVYFVMKYIEGRSLESVIKEVGALPISIIQTILNQAGTALGHAHRRGVVHRDVKPGNVMLDQDGWAVMTDFGIAKVAQAEALTMTGGMVGTPAYMSPEQCQGAEITGAADQYSLGIVAYEMLTGKPPFAGTTMVNMLYDHCHTPPPSIEWLRADCPPELAHAVMRMIAKDPADRFPTIEDAVAAVGVAAETHDAVRTQIMTMMQSTTTAKLLDKFRTPASPVPHGRTGSPAPASSGGVPATRMAPITPVTPTPQPADAATAPLAGGTRRWITWAVPAVAVAFVGVFVLGRMGGGGGPAAPPAPATPAAPVARLDIMPLALALAVRGEAHVTAVPRDSTGAPTPRAVTWEALDPGVAVVSADGVVRGVSPGQARVVARSGGSSASVVVTVSAARAPSAAAAPAAPPAESRARPMPQPVPEATVARLTLEPGELALAVGAQGRLTADRPVTWRSSNPGVASVDAGGVVTALAAGTATIVASAEGVSAAATVAVSGPAAVPEPAPTDPRPEIRQVIEQYRLAIEARDVQRIRRLYPGLTRQQEQAWNAFFGGVSDLSARLQIASLETAGDSARVTVTAVYDFRADRRQTQNTTFTMRLRRASAGWQIVSVQ